MGDNTESKKYELFISASASSSSTCRPLVPVPISSWLIRGNVPVIKDQDNVKTVQVQLDGV
ncbi:unnamed protein product [Prunus armeniaca]|uniref:Uncharacterized protein n=1 Tax=Prunus armeniaca TaxID=36596 RepID=A0A6J5U9M0_PRUAR|nr:unnamed protein product [Prunus armeniaca]CAB4303459.1 unnamed protein product [Prunus armeniaca]